MKSRAWWMGLVALVVLAHATGCCRHCCCCTSDRDSRLPARDTFRDERPAPRTGEVETLPPANVPTGSSAVPPSGPPKVTGAYGGS